jgi:hypothetical protein
MRIIILAAIDERDIRDKAESSGVNRPAIPWAKDVQVDSGRSGL